MSDAAKKIGDQQLQVEIAIIDESPTNPRKFFDAEADKGLAASIATHGVLQAVLLRPKGARFEVVAGHRRLRASKVAGLKLIPATIRVLTDTQAAEIQLIENVQREDITILEEAAAYAALVSKHKHTAETIAKATGKSKETIYLRLRLNDIKGKLRKALDEGKLEPTAVITISRAPEELHDQIASEAIGHSLRQVENITKHFIEQFETK